MKWHDFKHAVVMRNSVKVFNRILYKSICLGWFFFYHAHECKESMQHFAILPTQLVFSLDVFFFFKTDTKKKIIARCLTLKRPIELYVFQCCWLFSVMCFILNGVKSQKKSIDYNSNRAKHTTPFSKTFAFLFNCGSLFVLQILQCAWIIYFFYKIAIINSSNAIKWHLLNKRLNHQN